MEQQNETKVINIDTRSIEEIAKENQTLKEKLKYNIQCINFKKHMKATEKIDKAMEELLKRKRKTFAFRIDSDIVSTATQTEILPYLNKIVDSNKGKIKNIFIINNFVYFKTNISFILSDEQLKLENGYVLEQINPKDVINSSNIK